MDSGDALHTVINMHVVGFYSKSTILLTSFFEASSFEYLTNLVEVFFCDFLRHKLIPRLISDEFSEVIYSKRSLSITLISTAEHKERDAKRDTAYV